MGLFINGICNAKLNSSKKVLVERLKELKDYKLEGRERELCERHIIKGIPASIDCRTKSSQQDEEASAFLLKIYDFEKRRWGLQDYY